MTEPLYDFRSDNVDGAAPEILEALVEANSGTAAPYGDDEYTRRMNERVAALFERPVSVFPLSSGTGSNSVALAAKAHGIELEVLKHTKAKRGFVLLPRRWVVERSFAWTARFRRLARDYERLAITLAAYHWLAFALLMLKSVFPKSA